MNSHKDIEISILCYGMQPEDLRVMLNDRLSNLSNPPELLIKPSISRFRTLEPSILVAIVGGASAALGALITNLLKIAQQRKIQKIVIQGKSGAKLEVPADTPSERIDELLEKVREMDTPHILL